MHSSKGQPLLALRPTSGDWTLKAPRGAQVVYPKDQAMIVALACSGAPEGRARWTAKLLANRAVELEVIESVSESTVRRVLKKTR